MMFELPSEQKFTIYSKSGCINCRKVKDLLKKNNIEYEIVDCDDYLLEDKENFLLFIQSYSVSNWKSFPMVFHDGKFIGGYDETVKYLDKITTSFDF
jgi:glutaredoxin-related protein